MAERTQTSLYHYKKSAITVRHRPPLNIQFTHLTLKTPQPPIRPPNHRTLIRLIIGLISRLLALGIPEHGALGRALALDPYRQRDHGRLAAPAHIVLPVHVLRAGHVGVGQPGELVADVVGGPGEDAVGG